MAEPQNRASASVSAVDPAVGKVHLGSLNHPSSHLSSHQLLGLRLDPRTGLVAIGAWSLLGVGCAGLGEKAPEPSTRVETREVARGTGDEAVQASTKTDRNGAPARVVFSDESDPVTEPGAGSTSAQELTGAGLVDALAQSYEADRAALAAMRTRKDAAAAAPSAGTASVAFEGAEAATTQTGSSIPASTNGLSAAPAPTPTTAVAPTAGGNSAAPNTTTAAPNTTTAAPNTATAAPNTATAAPNTTTSALNSVTAPSAAETSTPSAATNAASAATAQPGATAAIAAPGAIQANAALELPPALPTDPIELTRLLSESLIRASGESETPMAQWLAFAALAVANPDLALPSDFGSDLLEAERARVRKAHAAFASLGKSLRDGASGFDKSAQEDLLAALSVGPKLTIPKVDLCTRVEAFGRYSAIQNRRFLAGSSPRFIVYSEVDGFTSELEEGRFVTRLATRVSIETERDGVEVWRRSPEWTASSDRSETRRGEFFLCEIVALSEHLSVGGYRLKVEIRDEATGEVAVHALPFHVVADPTMVSVGD